MTLKWKSFGIFTLMFLILVACSNQASEPPIVTEPNEPAPPTEEKPSASETKQKRSVVLYFSDDELMGIYKVNREIEYEDESEIIQKTLDEWLRGPESSQSSLVSLIPDGTTLQFVEAKDGIAYVSFSEKIMEANLGSTGEAAITDQVAMIMHQFGYEATQILIDGNVVETLLGHMYLSEPIEAQIPDPFEWYQ